MALFIKKVLWDKCVGVSFVDKHSLMSYEYILIRYSME